MADDPHATWTSVDTYLTSALGLSDETVERALTNQREAGLPEINVSAPQGKQLALIAQSIGAKKILEVGTLGGYSTIWMARALPADGQLITLELDEHHATTARASVEQAGLGSVVEVIQGPALETLERLKAEGAGPFDLAFIDADKVNNANYFKAALAMSRPGSVIIVDNVIRNGAVTDLESADTAVQGVHALNSYVASESRVSATTIQTVGNKGYDGYLMAVVQH